MPQIQPHESAALLNPAVVDAAVRLLDDDFALGCECADPSLQIERWSEFSAAAGEPS
jgi:hypothetical protein